MQPRKHSLIFTFITFLSLISVISINRTLAISLLLFVSTLLTLQGIFTLVWILSAWNDPSKSKQKRKYNSLSKPSVSFTILLPVRFEAAVIKDTLKSICNINYPEKLVQIIVICRHDDKLTPAAVYETINNLGKENITLLTLIDTYPINKPNGLNHGLRSATGDFVGIFDAEDEPHSDILKHVNSAIVKNNADVVQSGVQLMNINSPWFAAFNALEYYFWFKSGLPFFNSLFNVTTLGGNTVFFKRLYLTALGGWDDTNLTEDADVGIRLAVAGARSHFLYSEKLVTKEETPRTLEDFVKQRTRWVQGFLQVLFKGDWLSLTEFKQKLGALYFLSAPLIPMLSLLFAPVGIYIGLKHSVPLGISMFTYVPLFLLFSLLTIQTVGLVEFAKAFQIRLSFLTIIRSIFMFIPYVLLLSVATFRATIRFMNGNGAWEKTSHINSHRSKAYVS